MQYAVHIHMQYICSKLQYLVEDVYEREIHVALAEEYESQSLSATCTSTYGTNSTA